MEKATKTKTVTLGVLAFFLLTANLLLPVLPPKADTAALSDEAAFSADTEGAPGKRTGHPVHKTLTEKELAAIGRSAEEIILYHGCYGSKADSKVDSLLDEISEIDGSRGMVWKSIMEYWKYVNTDMKINTSVPAGMPDGDRLCIVVLGHELKPDGSMSSELKARLKVALACAGQYPDAYVMCTGGGTAKRNPKATEGGVMTQWMISHGVERSRLLTENKSRTTTENAVFCHEILRRECPQVDSVLLVTSSYHLPWGALMFEAEFLLSAAESGAPEIHVISNCANPASSSTYGKSQALRWQTAGMLELTGNRQLANVFYSARYRDYIRNKKPKL